ncbi:MAG: NfeD family protein [Eubacteriales bacterium]|nr:NfeD family protein [Eubacteriales bacterium]
MLKVWLIIMAAAVVFELLSPALISIWFAVGAGAAAISWKVGAPLYLQIVIFAAVSLLLMLVIAKPLKEWLDNNKDKNPPVPDDLIGRTGRVIEDIEPPEAGRVRVGDVDYDAEAVEALQRDDLIRVTGYNGIKLTVERYEADK